MQQIQTHTADRQTEEERDHEVENLDLESLLFRQGEVLLFLSLVKHQCITGNLEFITNTL